MGDLLSRIFKISCSNKKNCQHLLGSLPLVVCTANLPLTWFLHPVVNMMVTCMTKIDLRIEIIAAVIQGIMSRHKRTLHSQNLRSHFSGIAGVSCFAKIQTFEIHHFKRINKYRPVLGTQTSVGLINAESLNKNSLF